jgi:hypothetical protein
MLLKCRPCRFYLSLICKVLEEILRIREVPCFEPKDREASNHRPQSVFPCPPVANLSKEIFNEFRQVCKILLALVSNTTTLDFTNVVLYKFTNILY